MTKGFHAHEAALGWASALGPALAKVARGDADLARQLRRAVASVPLNLAEGSRRAGKDRIHHYRIAAGSAEEAMSGLALAFAWGHLESGDVAGADGYADRLRAMLWRLTHPRRPWGAPWPTPRTTPAAVVRGPSPWPGSVTGVRHCGGQTGHHAPESRPSLARLHPPMGRWRFRWRSGPHQ